MSYMSNVYDPHKHDLYTPINREKYLGKNLPVIRSSWEKDICKWFDYNEKIVAWISEPLEIPYFDVGNGTNRRYFPDFLVKIKTGTDKTTTFLVEVKPYKQTQPPKYTKRKNKIKFLNEEKTFKTNISKWKAANAYCVKKGWKFLILTEREIYGRK